MRILVTGGAGFIGSHLAERLVGIGHDVVVIDSEATGRAEHVPEGAEYRVGDVTRVADLEDAFGTGLDAVAHIAGQVSLVRSFTDPLVDLRTNLEGTVNVLGCCLRHRVPRLLYASSMTVYGHNGTSTPLPNDRISTSSSASRRSACTTSTDRGRRWTIPIRASSVSF
jgi:UDP-glucose 4-epimerase